MLNKEPRINRKYLYADFSDFSYINDDLLKKNSKRIFTGDVRINNSMYRTREETDKYIQDSLDRNLP